MKTMKQLAGLVIPALVSLGVRAQHSPTPAGQVVMRPNAGERIGLLACDSPSCAEALSMFCSIRLDRDGLLIGPVDVSAENKTTLFACKKAAELGSPSAQWRMATIEGTARGPNDIDYHATLRWLVPAAEQGYAEAQSDLGMMYLSGRGISKDSVQAYKWLMLSAWREPNNENLARELTKTMSPDQVREARELVNSWQPK